MTFYILWFVWTMVGFIPTIYTISGENNIKLWELFLTFFVCTLVGPVIAVLTLNAYNKLYIINPVIIKRRKQR